MISLVGIDYRRMNTIELISIQHVWFNAFKKKDNVNYISLANMPTCRDGQAK